jgi:hypothetical protein
VFFTKYCQGCYKKEEDRGGAYTPSTREIRIANKILVGITERNIQKKILKYMLGKWDTRM